MLTILFLLQCKHLIIDWLWQPEYEWKNKGTYGHWGGIRHSMKNAVGTTLCFVPFITSYSLLFIFIIDFMVHYHVDFAKMNINKITGWGPLTHPQFWWLTGLDQYLHQITYIILLFIFI